MMEFLIRNIEEKTTCTQEMNERLRLVMPLKPKVTIQALSKNLDGAMQNIKDLRSPPVQLNTLAVKRERRLFAEWLMMEGQNILKISVDEFGINVWTA